MKGTKLSHEEFIAKLKEINSTILILGHYIKADDLIECKCMTCGHTWNPRAKHLLEGQGCPKCNHYSPPIKDGKQFNEEVLKRNPLITLLGNYRGTRQHILCECKLCKYQWNARPSALLKGCGCPQCNTGGGPKRTHNDFISLLVAKDSNIECLDEYINAKTSIRFKCKVCGHEWRTQPYNIINNGTGCPKCNKYKLTHDEFIQRMNIINSNIDIIGLYVDMNTDIECRCKICGHKWSSKPFNLVSNKGCPQCCVSHGEKRIKQYLDLHNILYQPQKSYDGLVGLRGGLLSYDFYIEQYNTLIEYQGQFHDGTDKWKDDIDFQRQRIHDERKMEYANKHNIKLLEIWYYDFDKIEQILNEYFTKQNDLTKEKSYG